APVDGALSPGGLKPDSILELRPGEQRQADPVKTGSANHGSQTVDRQENLRLASVRPAAAQIDAGGRRSRGKFKIFEQGPPPPAGNPGRDVEGPQSTVQKKAIPASRHLLFIT